MHTSKMHSRRTNPPSVYYRGAPYPNSPTHLAPFRARTVRTMHKFVTHSCFASCFAVPFSPVDSHHDCIFSFRGRCSFFLRGDSSSANRSGIPEASLVRGSWVKTSSSVFFHIWALKFHRLRSELMPPTATVVAAETFVVSGCWCHTVVAAENS